MTGALQDRPREAQDVLAALTKGRDADRPARESREEILAQHAAVRSGRRLPMRRRDDPNVDLPRRDLPYRANLARRQNARQLRLKLGRQIADLVEKQRATVRRDEDAVRPLRGSGEGAGGVSEKLALGEGIRNGRAVHGHARSVSSAQAVDLLRDTLLADPRLAENEHRQRPGRDESDFAAQPLDDQAAAAQAWRLRLESITGAQLHVGHDHQRLPNPNDGPVDERRALDAHAIEDGPVATPSVHDRPNGTRRTRTGNAT